MPRRRLLPRVLIALGAVIAIGAAAVALLWWRVRPATQPPSLVSTAPTPAALDRHCREVIGAPRIERIGDRIFVAIGYDLANTILVRTPAGNVIIDAGMGRDRAERARADLLAAAPGPILALIYTHSHIDHVGAASVWADDATPIWATAAFAEHFFRQYGVLRRSESRRGALQFGWHVPPADLPCSALGARVDVEGALRTGVRLPTRTFTGTTRLDLGGTVFELHEAHGETDDQLFVWIPSLGALLPGDNYYQAFPNLYTIRGTTPRPIEAWIDSIDRMRRLSPVHLVPSHTPPLSGADRVARALTDYRDGIQWVRDQVLRAANRGDPIDAVAAAGRLPAHLARSPALAELYGQIDWSMRAIYDARVGWFDGRPEHLYPPEPRDQARRTVLLMGGVARVLEEARAAIGEAAGAPAAPSTTPPGPGAPGGGARWALHLLGLVRTGGLAGGEEARRLDQLEIAALRALAGEVANTNGRAWLLESAHRLASAAPAELPTPAVDMALVDAVPVPLLFQIMATRLEPARSIDAHESVRFEIDDRRFIMTVRRGVAELVEGDPLPGTPPPLAVLRSGAVTWRRVALGQLTLPAALATGRLRIDGDALGLARFIARFDRGL